MSDGDESRSLRDIVTAGFKLEFSTEPGKVNAFCCAVFAAIVVLLGVANGLQLLVRLFRPDYEADFPLLAVLFVFAGITMFCVGGLLLLEALIVKSKSTRTDRDDDPR